jgi:hypothetical protein
VIKLEQDEALVFSNDLGFITAHRERYVVYSGFDRFFIPMFEFDKISFVREIGSLDPTIIWELEGNTHILTVKTVKTSIRGELSYKCSFEGVFIVGRRCLIKLDDEMYSMECGSVADVTLNKLIPL